MSSMTEPLVLAIALFVVTVALTLSLASVFSPHPTVRRRARQLLLDLFRRR